VTVKGDLMIEIETISSVFVVQMAFASEKDLHKTWKIL